GRLPSGPVPFGSRISVVGTAAPDHPEQPSPDGERDEDASHSGQAGRQVRIINALDAVASERAFAILGLPRNALTARDFALGVGGAALQCGGVQAVGAAGGEV